MSASMLWIVSMRPLISMVWLNAVVVTAKPLGTENPARMSSPRLAPFPPTKGVRSVVAWSNHNIGFDVGWNGIVTRWA